MGVSDQAFLALLLGFFFVIDGEPTGENQAAFTTLCHLIELTKKEIALPASVDAPTNLEDDLIKLNMTTAEDEWYNLFTNGAQPEATWEKAKEREPFKTWEAGAADFDWKEMYEKWKAAKQQLLTDSGERGRGEFVRPPSGYRRQMAHQKIRRIWKIYKKVEGERSTLKAHLQANKSEIEKAFKLARANKDDGEVTAGPPTFDHANRGNACGGSNGGTVTGKSLANDITCLCTGTTGSFADNLCLNSDNSGTQWNVGGSDTAYAAVAAKCGTINVPTPTAQSIERLLRNFTALLGKNTADNQGTTANFYTLGGGSTGVSGGACAGGSSAVQVCVNYKANLHGGEAKGIPWVHQLERAASLLETFAEEEKRLHALDAREEALRDAALIAYEETKIPEPTASASPTGPSKTAEADASVVSAPGAAASPGEDGKTTASTARNNRFILTWILFI